jgi:hypothetical protein
MQTEDIKMPFDFTSPSQDDPLIVFRERREWAAAIWREVPSCVFDMFNWRFCALGWLAGKRHDGWYFSSDEVPTASYFGRGHVGAARYFGLTKAQSALCFGCKGSIGSTTRFHRRWFPSRITPVDVGRTLLALPYTVDATVSA